MDKVIVLIYEYFYAIREHGKIMDLKNKKVEIIPIICHLKKRLPEFLLCVLILKAFFGTKGFSGNIFPSRTRIHFSSFARRAGELELSPSHFALPTSNS